MKKKYLFKKRSIAVFKFIVSSVSKILQRSYKLLFTKRTIMFVTNEKIRSFTMGPVFQACLFLLIAWVVNLFFQSLRYEEVISAKSDEINKLKSMNGYFKSEFENMDEKIKKVNEYLSNSEGNIHNVKIKEYKTPEPPKTINQKEITKRDKQTMKKIKNLNIQLAEIEYNAQDRIKKIEKVISMTGLNIKNKNTENLSRYFNKNTNTKDNLAQGGPLYENLHIDRIVSRNSKEEDYLERKIDKFRFVSSFNYLMVLEKLVAVMPLSRPMKNSYHISSGFGARRDPITGRTAIHQGLDFVGRSNAKIFSPSQGKIILAGKFSDYGNAVVIDHGFGITTRYGHLSAVKVKEGQIVKKGELIALQGNTGRSTGSHLHYEIRYKNIPLNPRKFMEAGDMILNNKTSNYVNS